MALIYLDRPPSGSRNVYEKKFSVAADSTSDYLVMQLGSSRRAGITAIPSGGSVKIQATTSPFDDVEADTAEWIDWDDGVVAVATQGALFAPVQALRAVTSGGGTAVITVVT